MPNNYLDFFIGGRSKQAVIPAPGGNPVPPPGQPPMGAPPMDPAMMGGAPPMDPAMMGGAPPMDPAMMGGAPAAPAAPIEQEIASIKDMLQQLMDAQIAMMQLLGGGGLPPAGSPPPTDPAMMGAPSGMGGGVDPAMMGLPSAPPPGMIAQASVDDEDFNNYIKTITELLR